jgi:hypothetical protein
MSPSIRAAMKNGDFIEMPLPVALDFIAGNIFTAVVHVSEDELDDNYLNGLVVATLRGVGLPERRIATLMAMPLKPLTLGPDTLCQRSHLLFLARRPRKKH